MKKITSILILICMVISMSSFPVMTKAAVAVDFAEDFGVLDALSVIDEKTWSDGSITTRAEFIQLCVNLTGSENITAFNTEPIFTDLTVNHWAYNAIMYAHSMGYISPYEDGRIMPESPVTYGEAIKILVNFLGYEIVAAGKNKGDVTNAYFETAFEIGLLDNVYSDGIDRPFLKSSAVRMAYNSLNVELPVKYFSNNNVFFNVQNERTLLRVKFDTYRAKGVVRADDYSSLSHDLARENHVTIDFENYFSANVNIEGLLGCKVLYYYKQPTDSEEKELLYIAPANNEIIEISADNLDGYSNMKVKATSDTGKKSEYKIAKDTTVIWNNKILKSSEYPEKFKIKSGMARLIDNDEDGVIEVVILESLKSGKIAINNTKDMEIKLEDGSVYKLDEYRNYRIENKYGEKIDVLSLHVEDIVTVVDPLSKDHTLVIQVCSKQDPQILSTKDFNGYITVGDGSEMKFSKVAISGIEDLSIGDSYIFYTDKYGEIVYSVYVRSSELEVVYLIYYKTQSGLSNDLEFRIMRADGTITKMYGAKNIKIRNKNGEFSVKKQADIKTMLNQGHAEPYRQPVMIRTNALGQINEIYMLASPEHTELTFHEIAFNKVGGSGKRWYQPAYTFHNVIQLKPETTVMAVPHSTCTDVDFEEFFVTTYRLFRGAVYYPESGENAYYQIPIGLEKGAVAADYFIWEYPKNAEARANYLNTVYKCIITKTSQIIDENGEEFVEVTYCTMSGLFGNTVLYRNTDGSLNFTDSTGRKINVGDVVSIGVDYLGYADNASIKTYYDCVNKLIINEGDSSSPAFYAWRIAKGVINEKKDGYIDVTITRPNGSTAHQILNLASAVTINCNLNESMFMKDRAPDSLLSKGDEFFLVISGGLPSTLLVYE